MAEYSIHPWVGWNDIATAVKTQLAINAAETEAYNQAMRWQGMQDYETMIQSGIDPGIAMQRAAGKLFVNEPRSMAYSLATGQQTDTRLKDLQFQREKMELQNQQKMRDYMLKAEIQNQRIQGMQDFQEALARGETVDKAWAAHGNKIAAGNPAQFNAGWKQFSRPDNPKEVVIGGNSWLIQPNGVAKPNFTSASQRQERVEVTTKLGEDQTMKQFLTPEQIELQQRQKAAAEDVARYNENQAEIAAKNVWVGPEWKYWPSWLTGGSRELDNQVISNRLYGVGLDVKGQPLPPPLPGMPKDAKLAPANPRDWKVGDVYWFQEVPPNETTPAGIRAGLYQWNGTRLVPVRK